MGAWRDHACTVVHDCGRSRAANGATSKRTEGTQRTQRDFTDFEGLEEAPGFPQSAEQSQYIADLDIPENERLAFCFSQWTALLDQPQVPNFVMDLCSSIYNRMKGNDEEVYKRFLFHYTRALDPALKTGESHITTEEFTKKGMPGTVGRPFFLFRPRNGRKVSIDEH
ncbi:neuromedin-S [Hyperolius riggenbachi]|uniref:neuromedin-S n=1 Tax=Hyperolius riggenbachi TaxID=752182 RepID=UPI0035A2E47C